MRLFPKLANSQLPIILSLSIATVLAGSTPNVSNNSFEQSDKLIIPTVGVDILSKRSNWGLDDYIKGSVIGLTGLIFFQELAIRTHTSSGRYNGACYACIAGMTVMSTVIAIQLTKYNISKKDS